MDTYYAAGAAAKIVGMTTATFWHHYHRGAGPEVAAVQRTSTGIDFPLFREDALVEWDRTRHKDGRSTRWA